MRPRNYRSYLIFAAAGAVIACARAFPKRDKANEFLVVTEQKTSLRPFEFAETKLSANLMYAGFRGAVEGFPGSPDGSRSPGFNREVFEGVGMMVVGLPLTVLSIPVDIISAPFHRRTLLKGTLEGCAVDAHGLPVMHTPVRGRKYSRYSSLSGMLPVNFLTETDGTGCFGIFINDCFFGKPNNDLKIEIEVEDLKREFQIIRHNDANLELQDAGGNALVDFLIVVRSTDTKNDGRIHQNR